MIYIYALICPLSGEPRYIGKTQNPNTRLRAHVSKAKTGQTNHHCAHWIRQLQTQNMQPKLVVLFEVPEDEEWQRHEVRLIAEYKEKGYDLTNLTGGGGGFYKADPELLKRRGIARSKSLADPETKRRFIEAVKKGQTAEVIEKRTASIASSWKDPAKRAAYLAGMAKPDATQRRAAATIKRMHDPATAAAHKQKMKDLFKDPARQEQLRQASLKRWAIYRERKNAAAEK